MTKTHVIFSLFLIIFACFIIIGLIHQQTNKTNQNYFSKEIMFSSSGFKQDSITGKWYKEIRCKTIPADSNTFCTYGIWIKSTTKDSIVMRIDSTSSQN